MIPKEKLLRASGSIWETLAKSPLVVLHPPLALSGLFFPLTLNLTEIHRRSSQKDQVHVAAAGGTRCCCRARQAGSVLPGVHFGGGGCGMGKLGEGGSRHKHPVM